MLQSRARRCAACVVEYRWLTHLLPTITGQRVFAVQRTVAFVHNGARPLPIRQPYGYRQSSPSILPFQHRCWHDVERDRCCAFCRSASRPRVQAATQLLCARNDCGKHALLAIGGCRLPLSMAVSHRCWGHWLSRAVLPQPHVVARRRPAARHSVCVVQFAAAEFRRFFNGI